MGGRHLYCRAKRCVASAVSKTFCDTLPDIRCTPPPRPGCFVRGVSAKGVASLVRSLLALIRNVRPTDLDANRPSICNMSSETRRFWKAGGVSYWSGRSLSVSPSVVVVVVLREAESVPRCKDMIKNSETLNSILEIIVFCLEKGRATSNLIDELLLGHLLGVLKA